MHTILFRLGIDHEHEEEFKIAKQYFNVVELRTNCPSGDTIIGRFSLLPFYRELESDLNNIGAKLINTWEEHSWISDFRYYEDLKEYTAESWNDYNFHTCKHEGPFVIKGKTNSRKFNWETHMFAKTKSDALRIASDLMTDSLIGPHGVIYRKYIPLVTHEIGLNGLPFSNEWRLFYYKGTRLSFAPYWTMADDPGKAKITEEGLAFADKVASIAKDHVNFFVLDIAEKAEGGWVLIEVNDGCQSGLSMNDPHVLYSNLKKALENQ